MALSDLRDATRGITKFRTVPGYDVDSLTNSACEGRCGATKRTADSRKVRSGRPFTSNGVGTQMTQISASDASSPEVELR